MTTGKEAHGNSFFDRNEQDLIQAVTDASAWIREKLQAGHGIYTLVPPVENE